MRLLHSTVLALLGLRTIQALPLAQDSTVEQVGSQTVQDPSSSPAWPDQVGGWLYQNRNNFLTAAGVLGGTKTLQWALSRTLDGHVGKKAARIMRKTPEQEREKVRALTPQERVEYREQVARMLHKHNGIDLDEARCIVVSPLFDSGRPVRKALGERRLALTTYLYRNTHIRRQANICASKPLKRSFCSAIIAARKSLKLVDAVWDLNNRHMRKPILKTAGGRSRLQTKQWERTEAHCKVGSACLASTLGD